jgi:hypothetical protein
MKVNSGQKKKVAFITGKCFPFDKERKTLSYLYIKHISNPCLSLSLTEKNWSRNNWSISLEQLKDIPLISSIFFLKFLYIISFMFLSSSFRSVRIMVKILWSCLICCVCSKKNYCFSMFFSMLFKQTMINLLPVKFFHNTIFFFILPRHIRLVHRKNKPNSSSKP